MAADEVQRVLETLLQPLISRVELLVQQQETLIEQQKTLIEQQKILIEQQKTLIEQQIFYKELGALTEVLDFLVERSIREELELCRHPSNSQLACKAHCCSAWRARQATWRCC